MRILGIYGCGGAGRESKEIADLLGLWDEIVFIDDAYSNDVFHGIRRLNYEEFVTQYADKKEVEISISLGEPELKRKLFDRIKKDGYGFANIIHPSALVSPSAKLGVGLIIKPHALVSTEAVIGDNVSIEENGIIGHDSVIESHCQISANVVVAGGCHIGEATYIGLSVPIKQGASIGSNSVVGMGSVVIRDIPDNVIALGNPARAMKNKNDSRVFG